MKRSLAAALGALALVASLPASAADLPARGMPYKAPAYAPMYNWTGFYLGINGGGAFGDSGWNGLGVSNSPGGGMVGGTIGYNWQGMGSPWVFGLEGDVDWSGVSDSTTCGAFTCQTKNTWFGTVRGRLGYAFDRTLVYGTGGFAYGSGGGRDFGLPNSSRDDFQTGYAVGGGIEDGGVVEHAGVAAHLPWRGAAAKGGDHVWRQHRQERRLVLAAEADGRAAEDSEGQNEDEGRGKDRYCGEFT